MESIIKDQLVQYLVTKGLISKHQHAFIKNHSTATNLLESINDWFVSLKSPNRTDVVYIDFSKAFDSIVISKLLFKLESYGITGQLLSWIACFLSDRTQCVVVDRCQSSFNRVISGVPQGSVLGPILFLLFINDIDSVCCGNAKLQLFADDAKIYSSINIDSISVSLQNSLDNLCSWANDWQMTINIGKCAVLSVCSKPVFRVQTYYINGFAVTHNNSYKDLGITVCQNLSFIEHINNVVSKARQRVCMIFRGFISRDCEILRRAFITYVRPIIEYNTIVWNPCAKYLIDLIESVQRNFTKRIPSLTSLSYAERIAILNLETLELRRLRFDLIFYYKVFNRLTPFDPSAVFCTYLPPPSLRCNSPVLQKPIKASNKLLSGIFYRYIDAWNNLPADLRLLSNLSSFKRGLRRIDFSTYLKGSMNTV
jgi:ribonuclease P/MRP protein subunit RPP40